MKSRNKRSQTADVPPAHDGIDGTSGYLILKTSRNLSDSTESREQKRKVILSELRLLGEAFKVITQDPAKEPYLEKLSEIVAMTHKIGVLYNEAVKALNTYHSVATAQQLLSKLETYSQLLIRLQQQAVQLTKSLESK